MPTEEDIFARLVQATVKYLTTDCYCQKGERPGDCSICDGEGRVRDHERIFAGTPAGTKVNYDAMKDCDHCGGRGRVYTPASMVRRLERSLWRAGAGGQERRLVLRVHPEVALHVLENEPDFLERMSRVTRVKLELRDDPLMHPDQFRMLSGRAESDVTHKYTTS